MKSLRTAAALAAIAALPALAGPTPRAAGPFDDDFTFSFDVDDMLAQAQPAPPPPPPDARQWKEYGERMSEWAQEISSEVQGSLALAFSDRVGHGRLVKGAPYSAEAVSETRQTLGDGNVISHENRSRVFRDGEGRTRQETYRKGELRSIYINDPVAHVSYTLLPRSKLAVARVARDSRTPRAEEPVSGDVRIEKSSRTIVIDKDGQPGAREEVRVRVMRGEDDRDLPAPPAPPSTPPPPLPPGAWDSLAIITPFPGEESMRFHSPPEASQPATSKLGAKDIEGVKAEGVSTVWTIPAGRIGNRNPINITRETWTSPELHVTVYSRYNDPRSGESIYRLAAVKRAEPSPDLFKVPEGYKVKERHGGAAPVAPVAPVPPVPGVHPAPPAPPAPPPPRG